MNKIKASALALLAAVMISGCGFHLVGKGGNLPPNIKVIGIPTFKNSTDRQEIEQRITDQITNEFIGRGEYRIVAHRKDVDALLEGEVTHYSTRPVQFDDDNRATEVEVEVRASITFTDFRNNRKLFNNSNYVFKDEYEIDPVPEEYLDPEIIAIDRVARDFARSVAAAILEGF